MSRTFATRPYRIGRARAAAHLHPRPGERPVVKRVRRLRDRAWWYDFVGRGAAQVYAAEMERSARARTREALARGQRYSITIDDWLDVDIPDTRHRNRALYASS